MSQLQSGRNYSMHYDLLNNLISGTEAWTGIKQRVLAENRTVLTLTAAPRFFGLIQEEGVKGLNILDYVTKREYVKDQYRFFNDVPVPTWSKVEMNRDGSILIVDNGDVIAREYLFPNTRRAVQDIRYNNPDGTLDYIEEYAFDGTLYSNLFYADNILQEIVFYNSDSQPVVRYYFYDGAINFITIEDPKTHKVIKDYANLNEYLNDQLSKLLTEDDTVTFQYMGIEMNVLKNTKSHNVLEVVESVLDESGVVRGNLAMILEGKIPYVAEVKVDAEQYEALRLAGMPLDRVSMQF